MFSFFQRRKPTPGSADLDRSHEHDPEWLRLRNQYADPAIELATTKQAVIVSAASVLDRIWNANGGENWSESQEEDYIAPLREHLLDPPSFPPKHAPRSPSASMASSPLRLLSPARQG
jgi:hypothetical protein